MTRTEVRPQRGVTWGLSTLGILLGVVVAVLTSDVILGVIAGSALIAVTLGVYRLWTGR